MPSWRIQVLTLLILLTMDFNFFFPPTVYTNLAKFIHLYFPQCLFGKYSQIFRNFISDDNLDATKTLHIPHTEAARSSEGGNSWLLDRPPTASLMSHKIEESFCFPSKKNKINKYFLHCAAVLRYQVNLFPESYDFGCSNICSCWPRVSHVLQISALSKNFPFLMALSPSFGPAFMCRCAFYKPQWNTSEDTPAAAHIPW